MQFYSNTTHHIRLAWFWREYFYLCASDSVFWQFSLVYVLSTLIIIRREKKKQQKTYVFALYICLCVFIRWFVGFVSSVIFFVFVRFFLFVEIFLFAIRFIISVCQTYFCCLYFIFLRFYSTLTGTIDTYTATRTLILYNKIGTAYVK